MSEAAFQACCHALEAVLTCESLMMALPEAVGAVLRDALLELINDIDRDGQYPELAGGLVQAAAKAQSVPASEVMVLLMEALGRLHSQWRPLPYGTDEDRARRVCVLLEVSRALLQRAGWWAMWGPATCAMELPIDVESLLVSLIRGHEHSFRACLVSKELDALDLGSDAATVDAELVIRCLGLFTPFVGRGQHMEDVSWLTTGTMMLAVRAADRRKDKSKSSPHLQLLRVSLRCFTHLALAGIVPPQDAKLATHCLITLSDDYDTDRVHPLYHSIYRRDYICAVLALSKMDVFARSIDVAEKQMVYSIIDANAELVKTINLRDGSCINTEDNVADMDVDSI